MARHILPVLAILLATTGPLAAQTASPDDWIVTIRANARLQPAYPGAKNFGFTAYPSFSFRRASTKQTFTAPDDQISFALYDNGWLKAGPSGRFISARKAKDHRELTGIHDVDWTLELGAFAEFWPLEKVRARLDLRKAVNGHKGFVADAGVDFVETSGAWTFSVGPRIVYGDQTFAKAWFGVTPAESVANGRVAPYNASSGLNSVGATASVNYTFDSQWQATAYVRHDHLVGAAARSPVVRVLGTDQQTTFGLKIAYSFPVKSR